jgi:hypothetical protein
VLIPWPSNGRIGRVIRVQRVFCSSRSVLELEVWAQEWQPEWRTAELGREWGSEGVEVVVAECRGMIGRIRARALCVFVTRSALSTLSAMPNDQGECFQQLSLGKAYLVFQNGA